MAIFKTAKNAKLTQANKHTRKIIKRFDQQDFMTFLPHQNI